MQEATLAVVIPYLSRVTTVLRFTLDFYTECINTNTVDLIVEIDGSKAHMITHYINRAMRKGAFSENSRYIDL